MEVEYDAQDQPSMIARMEAVLTQKQAVIDEKLKSLNERNESLRQFEAKLLEKVKELQSAQEKLKKEQEDLQIETAAEHERIRQKWDEIRMYEEKLQASTEEVLSEKIKYEIMQKERLETELNDAFTMDAAINQDLLNMAAAVGIDVDVPKADVPKEDAVKENVPKEDAVPENAVQHNLIPSVFLDLDQKIRESGFKWNVLELLPDRYCLQYQEKEIRFFRYDNRAEVQIIIFKKNARSDKRLQGNLVKLERIEPKWSVMTEENRVIYTMAFMEDGDLNAVLKDIREFMKNHL